MPQFPYVEQRQSVLVYDSFITYPTVSSEYELGGSVQVPPKMTHFGYQFPHLRHNYD